MLQYGDPFLLSSTGSTRATAYGWSNRIVTVGDKTHVVWLDAIARVCGRTFDHATGQWGPTFPLFDGADNHANPSLSADRAGRLRLVYGPHGWYGNWNQGRVKWTMSESPGQWDRWAPEVSFGYNATGASIVHHPEGLDAVVCRGGEPPASTVFHRQRKLGGWTTARELFRQDIEPQYTHHYGHLLCDSEGRLFAACHFYNVGGIGNRDPRLMRSHGMAVLKSTDLGDTWTDLRGEPVRVPTLYNERIALPPLDTDMYVNSLALGPGGQLFALTMQHGLEDRRLLLSRWEGGEWKTQHLEKVLPGDRVSVDGSLTIDARGKIHVAVTAPLPLEVGGSPWWGHPTSEVFHLFSSDGAESFECRRISHPNGTAASWLPSLPKFGPCHPVEKVLLLYTCGLPGDGLRPETRTEVYAVWIENENP